MNEKELVEKFMEICKQADRELVVFISIANNDTGDSNSLGVGCPACHVENVILVNYAHDEYEHARAKTEKTH